MAHPILTIGHSRHSLERFLSLLETAQVSVVADVRSAPVSRFSPHFNKNVLSASLAGQGIDYVFLGQALGGRPERPEMYTQGRADYEKMAASPEFRAGLAQLIETAEQHRLVAMCSEADPLDCHRCLLVGRALAESGVRGRAYSRLGRDRQPRARRGPVAPTPTSRRRRFADALAGGALGRSLSLP